MPAGSKFEKHINTPHTLPCSDCKLLFIDEAKLQKHTRKEHTRSAEQSRSSTPEARKTKVARRRSGDGEVGEVGEYWLCALCGGPEETEAHLAKHLRKLHEQRCEVEGCERNFITKVELFKHQRQHLPELAFKGVYLCDTCDEMVEVS